ncbi:MAG: NADH-quinone oxidoreductase subunit E [Hyphobacterium sp.]|nr:MAG: NADH-quinone oxidoreductase subunit E [Hyphobacterium sp.]
MANSDSTTGSRADEGVSAICAKYDNRPDALIEILIDLQAERGCIADADIAPLADTLNLSRAEIHGVRSFYSDFSSAPKGRVSVKLCRAEACKSVGGDALAKAVEKRLSVQLGHTSPSGDVSLEEVYCLGNCALAPAALVGDRLLGRATADKIANAIGKSKT